MRSLGLTNRLGALILPQIATLLAFGSFWMRAFFRAVPPELIDAAQVDGAGHWRVLWRVLLPISWPHVSAMMVLMFMWTWNEFLLALVMVVNESVRTAPLSLTFFVGRFQADFTLIAAGALLVAAPVILFYVVFQRQFVHGITGGAVKE